jgi:dihydrofolate synthase/folylpolyglutamate synthase
VLSPVSIINTEMRFDTLDDWLRWQETLHPSEIELGLARVGEVLARMGLAHPDFRVITVAGTNGKGSSVAMLSAIYQAGGYAVGAYTSPHLWRYNERIRINGVMADDDTLCRTFEIIDEARGEISLTYFEFGTLAAIHCFAQAGVDVAIMEVGLGGRLDAVNILDPDVALITAIHVDHAQWLGDDRETIAREKAGIMRAGRPVVCSDPKPPHSIAETAAHVGARLYSLRKDFGWETQAEGWQWHSQYGHEPGLPRPAFPGMHQLNNAAGVLMVLELLGGTLPVDRHSMEEGLAHAKLPGRFQVEGEGPDLIFDVAHNPQSAKALVQNLLRHPCTGNTYAVMAMLDDKDIQGVVEAMKEAVDIWYVATLDMPRGAQAKRLAELISEVDEGKSIRILEHVSQAKDLALATARPEDRVVVFGSFYTVAAALSETV